VSGINFRHGLEEGITDPEGDMKEWGAAGHDIPEETEQIDRQFPVLLVPGQLQRLEPLSKHGNDQLCRSQFSPVRTRF
jgi:hypothetical protein